MTATVLLVQGGWGPRNPHELDAEKAEIEGWGYRVEVVDYPTINSPSDLEDASKAVRRAIALTGDGSNPALVAIGFSLGSCLLAHAIEPMFEHRRPRIAITLSGPFTHHQKVPIPHATDQGRDWLECIKGRDLSGMCRWLAFAARQEFVPVGQSRRWVQALEAHEVPARLVIVDSDKHASGYWDLAAPTIRRALKRALR